MDNECNCVSPDKQVSLRDRLNRLYKCRDLEISNLWQRSVFLSVFLTLCFTGYGVLIFEIIKPGNYCNNSSSLHLLAAGLSSLGSIFSIIWIYMAKASKAWYEVYEVAICKFEDEYQSILNIPEKFMMGKKGLPKNKIDNCLLSMKSGAYSPSKINILIGQTSLLIWLLLLLAHVVFFSFCEKITIDIYVNVFFILVLLILLSPFIFWICTRKKSAKSSSLSRDFDEDGNVQE